MSFLRSRTNAKTCSTPAATEPNRVDVLSFPQTRERCRSRFHVTVKVSGGWDGDTLKLGCCNIGKSQDQFLTLIQFVCRQLHLQLGDGKFTSAEQHHTEWWVGKTGQDCVQEVKSKNKISLNPQRRGHVSFASRLQLNCLLMNNTFYSTEHVGKKTTSKK